MTTAEKLTTIAENQWRVYEAGQKSVGALREVVGDPVRLEYVHITEHKPDVRLTSDTITDFSEVSLVSYGFNLWDEQVEVGGIGTTNGIDVTATDKLRSKNYIKVTPSTKYYIKCPAGLVSTGGLIQIYRYDAEKSFIGYGSTGLENGAVDTGANWHYIRFVIRKEYGTQYNNDICFSYYDGTRNGEYEPYVGGTFTANTDGTVQGVISLSPCTTLVADRAGVRIAARYYADDNVAYHQFWDAYQSNGNRTEYAYAFSGSGWNDATYNPKYPLDTGVIVNGTNMFNASNITEIGNISFENATSCSAAFINCGQLNTVAGVAFPTSNTVSISNMFQGCNSLKSLTVLNAIANSINLASCPLTRDCFLGVLDALSVTATNKVLTLQKIAVEAAFTATEWEALAATKSNWRIDLV